LAYPSLHSFPMCMLCFDTGTPWIWDSW